MIKKDETFIIAEAGVNHNGDICLAYKLIDKAIEAGVDAIKFQTYKTEKLVSQEATLANYQKSNQEKDELQFNMLKKLELSYTGFKELKEYCNKKGIMFLSTPDEEESLDFLVDELEVPIIKIGSGELNNLPFLERVANKDKTIILSTGMSTLGEVETAIGTIRKVNDNVPINLLHCTTNYPAQYNEVNLKAMLTLKNAFYLPVGYSDHTLGIEVPTAAVGMGAEIIEKHFTLDKSMPGPDHSSSLNPEELKKMVNSIRNIEDALGNGIKKPTSTEENIKNKVRKSLVANNNLSKGQVVKKNDLTVKRPGNGIEPKFINLLAGKKINKSVQEDEVLHWSYFLSN